jgi:hypothetical protein
MNGSRSMPFATCLVMAGSPLRWPARARSSTALQDANIDELNPWAPKVLEAMTTAAAWAWRRGLQTEKPPAAGLCHDRGLLISQALTPYDTGDLDLPRPAVAVSGDAPMPVAQPEDPVAVKCKREALPGRGRSQGRRLVRGLGRDWAKKRRRKLGQKLGQRVARGRASHWT